MSYLINQLNTKVFVEQPLASATFAKYLLEGTTRYLDQLLLILGRGLLLLFFWQDHTFCYYIYNSKCLPIIPI